MSDALNYLIKARGETLGHYFAFLKECGKHLDPKTRNLISVITKVDAQTERGFRQYLGRAWIGGTAQKVIGLAECPVLVHVPSSPPPPNPDGP